MALNLSSIGLPIGPIIRDYNWKDIILYALSIGAGFDELNYTYEKNLKVIPTFSIAMITDFFMGYDEECESQCKRRPAWRAGTYLSHRHSSVRYINYDWNDHKYF
ncbi:MAG: hypothetical protein AB2L12_11355 [Smithellaceae bacterium]